MTRPAIEVRLDPESFAKLLADIKEFDAALSRALRMRLRLAGAAAVADIRRTLLEPTPANRGRNTGVRQALADATRVSVLAGARSQGVRITTSASGLSADQKAMLKAYNKPSWRHPTRAANKRRRSWRNPVAGKKSTGHDMAGGWVTEQGRPFFGAVIKSHQIEMHAAVEQALIEASAVMGDGTVAPVFGKV